MWMTESSYWTLKFFNVLYFLCTSAPDHFSSFHWTSVDPARHNGLCNYDFSIKSSYLRSDEGHERLCRRVKELLTHSSCLHIWNDLRPAFATIHLLSQSKKCQFHIDVFMSRCFYQCDSVLVLFLLCQLFCFFHVSFISIIILCCYLKIKFSRVQIKTSECKTLLIYLFNISFVFSMNNPGLEESPSAHKPALYRLLLFTYSFISTLALL